MDGQIASVMNHNHRGLFCNWDMGIASAKRALLFFFDQLNGMRPWFYLALGVQLTDGLFKGRLA